MCSLNAITSRSALYHSVKSTDAKEDDDGVDECVDDCFNRCVDSHVDCSVRKEDGVDDSVDGGDNHLTYVTQVVDCHLKSRKEQNVCGLNATKSTSVVYHIVKSTDAKEDGDGVDGCVDVCFK